MNEKRKPTGFFAVCQCGAVVGALDLERSARSDTAQMLGKWLTNGCAIHPQFTHTWSARLAPCNCATSKAAAPDKGGV